MEVKASFYPTVLNSSLPNEKLEASLASEKTVSKIRSLAIKIFMQAGFAFGLSLAVMTFVATPLSVVALTGALGVALGTAICQTAIDLYFKNKDLETVKKEFKPLTDISQAAMVNIIGLSGPNIAIHEAGHALAAMTFFKNASPEIQIFPFLGGMTRYTYSNGLTKLGSILGQHRAFMFIAAAGFISSTLFAMFEFALADKLKVSYPEISQMMSVHGVLQIAQEVLYGISAFLASQVDLAHDFVNLWISGGIHPLIPIALMITLPLIEIWLLKRLACREKSQKIQEMALPL